MISPVLVTQQIQYDPESYFDYCRENDEEPTQDGFHEYIQDWIADDFNSNYDVQIMVLL